MRKVIQITEGGVHLCNDGTMWKKLCLASDDDGEPSVKWLELDNVPQPEDGGADMCFRSGGRRDV